MVEFAAFIFLLLTSPLWVPIGIRLAMVLLQPISIALACVIGLVVAFNFPRFAAGLSCIITIVLVIQGIQKKRTNSHKTHRKYSHEDFVDQLLK